MSQVTSPKSNLPTITQNFGIPETKNSENNPNISIKVESIQDKIESNIEMADKLTFNIPQGSVSSSNLMNNTMNNDYGKVPK